MTERLTDMSSFEFDPLKDWESLSLPDDPSPGWCDFVSELYGKGDFHLVVTSSSFIRQHYVSQNYGGYKRLNIHQADTDDPNQIHAFEGVFCGLELRPDIELETEEMQHYTPFARMREVYDSSAGEMVRDQGEYDLLIPIRNTTVLCFMRQ